MSASGHELDSLANKLTDGNYSELANKSIQFFQSDLPRPDIDMLTPRDLNAPIPAEFIIPVFQVKKQLIKLDIYKAPGPDGVPTFFAERVLWIFNRP